jgi:Tol biopolymer transport system component
MKQSLVNMFLLGAAVALAGCGESLNLQQMEERARAAADRGFVREIDEPSSRGVLKRVTPDESDIQFRFALAPSGKDIVYSGIQGNSEKIRQLWRVSVAGGSPTKITSGGDEDSEFPSFTQDGKSVIYSSGGVMWKTPVSGAGSRMKIPGSGLGTDMAPDVSVFGKIVFCSSQRSSFSSSGSPKYFIWICDENGNNLTQLREGLFPRWSPDGNQIVFVHNGDIWTINTEGTDLTQLTNTADIYEGTPCYSPDAKKIAYTSNEGKDGKAGSFDYNIWIMKADGSEKSKITELASWDSWPLYASDGIYFLSARAASDMSNPRQRIWKLQFRR